MMEGMFLNNFIHSKNFIGIICRKALVQALKMLMLGRPGLTWSSEAPSEVSDLVVAMTDNLMEAGHLTKGQDSQELLYDDN